MTVYWPHVRAGVVTLASGLNGFSLPDDNAVATDVLVFAGQPGNSDEAAGTLAVGWTEQGDRGAFSTTPHGAGHFDTETGEVLCSLLYLGGDDNYAAAEVAAFDLVSLLTAAIKNDRTLGGALPQSSTASLSGSPLPTSDGLGVLLALSVSYTAPLT